MKICVIGAGACGLTALKTCLEDEHEVTCFEKTGNIAGLWRFRREDVDGLPSVMRTTVIDTSKEMSAFSDFPPSPKYANYMHNTSIVEYFNEYALHFNLLPHVRFNHKVLRLERHVDFEQNGKWNIQVSDQNGKTEEATFDAVMVCTGHHTFPYIPSFPGQEEFEGQIIHTHSYKDQKGFEEKNIAVVGVGNSGSDATVELSRVAKHVYWSTRRGVWVMSRVGPNGQPWDLVYTTRFYNFLVNKILSRDMANSYFEKKVSERMDHALYNLKPQHRFFEQHPTVGDDIPNAILTGKVTVRGNVERLTKKGVIFQGEKEEHPLDVLILATGYSMCLDFIKDDVITVKENKTDLYRLVFPPSDKHHTLAIIGFVQPYGCIFPCAEIQSRWAVRVFSGKNSLPSKKEMLLEVEERREKLKQQFVNTQRHTVECNFIEYVNEIAELIGAHPNMTTIAITDPKLWYACIFRPCLPYQFRLNGPHSWSGARAAILELDKRVKAPLLTRSQYKNGKEGGLSFIWIGAVALVVFLLFAFVRL